MPIEVWKVKFRNEKTDSIMTNTKQPLTVNLEKKRIRAKEKNINDKTSTTR